MLCCVRWAVLEEELVQLIFPIEREYQHAVSVHMSVCNFIPRKWRDMYPTEVF
jgi:hypothetical protein